MPRETSAAIGELFHGFSGYVQADTKSVYDVLFKPAAEPGAGCRWEALKNRTECQAPLAAYGGEDPLKMRVTPLPGNQTAVFLAERARATLSRQLIWR